MTKRHKTKVVDRIIVSLSAWKSQAPETSFSNLTYSQAELALAPPSDLRTQILALEKEIEGLKMQRIDADAAASKLLDAIISSIKGDLNHGKDSPLYRSCGYLRQSEFKPRASKKAAAAVVPAMVVMDASSIIYPVSGNGDSGNGGVNAA